MSWEWSHTEEAYSNARENVLNLDRGTLCVIRAEQLAHTNGEFDSVVYERTYATLIDDDKLPTEFIANCVADHMRDAIRSCDNGGFNAWCCPYGCHTVSFDLEDSNDS